MSAPLLCHNRFKVQLRFEGKRWRLAASSWSLRDASILANTYLSECGCPGWEVKNTLGFDAVRILGDGLVLFNSLGAVARPNMATSELMTCAIERLDAGLARRRAKRENAVREVMQDA